MWRTMIAIDDGMSRKLELDEPNNFHRLLWRMFGKRSEAGRDYTFRADERDGGWILVVQSRKEPNTDAIKGVVTKVKSGRISDIPKGTYDFTVRANSAKRDSHTKKLMPRRRDETIEWFRGRMLESGAKVVDVRLVDSYIRNARRNGEDHNVVRNVVELRGEIRVVNPKDFNERVLTGVGRAKFEGYGMIVLS